MTLHIRRIAFWSLLFLALLSVSSCGKRFSILDYQMNVVSVKPGVWDNGEITRYPSVDVRIDGPDAQDWEIIISPANGAMPYTQPTVTGKLQTVVLEGIDLSKDQREMGITIQVVHANTGETLAINRQYKATIEGNFDPVVPPAPQLTISIQSLTMVIGEESSSISVSGDNKASIDVLENYSGSLVLSYSKEEGETGPITCTLTQTEGKEHLTLSQDSIVSEESSFTIPFTSGEAGTGSFSVTLKGSGPETVLVISYVVKSRPYEATFVPNHFTFAELYDAHGTVNVFGFREGEKCDVILYWKETTSGDEGSTRYNGVDAKAPVDVILWKAGETAMGKEYTFWAEVYAEGGSEPVAVSEKKSATPFAISFAWTDTHGNPVGAGEVIRSWNKSYSYKMEVRTAAWAPEFLNKVTIKDITAERTYSSQEPIADTEGAYGFEMKQHHKRGIHQFSVTLETIEGDYSFETEMTFIDVWTVKPYAQGWRLYAKFIGPESSIQVNWNISLTIRGYALWDYTVAETDESGHQVNTPKQAKKYIGSRTETKDIKKNEKEKKMTSMFDLAMRMLKEKCSDKPFSMSGLTATRWSGSSITTYTPAASNTFVEFDIKADAPFYNDFNELETDLSDMKSTLNENGIYY